MKNLCIVLVVSFCLSGCGNSTTDDKGQREGTDSVGLTNPSSIDTVKHPTGMDNSSVISTDTAAMNVQNTIKKADSIAAQKAK